MLESFRKVVAPYSMALLIKIIDSPLRKKLINGRVAFFFGLLNFDAFDVNFGNSIGYICELTEMKKRSIYELFHLLSLL